METIRKRICFECATSRQQGLLPYIMKNEVSSSGSNTYIVNEICYVDGFSKTMQTKYTISANTKQCVSDFRFVKDSDIDGNYGGFVCNPYFSGGTGAELFGVGYYNYMDIIHMYNVIVNSIYAGLKLKLITLNGKYYFIDNFDDIVEIYDYVITDSASLTEVSDGKYQTNSSISVAEMIKYINECGIVDEKRGYSQKYSGNTNQYIVAVDNYDEIVSMSERFGGIKYVNKFLKFVEDNFIGKLNIPYEIDGDSVPNFLYYSDIVEWIEWFERNSGTTDCCIIQQWKKRGGVKMYNFLKGNEYLYTEAVENAKNFFVEDTSGLRRHVPKLSIDLFLTVNEDNAGKLSEYMEDGIDYSFSGIDFDIELSGGTDISHIDSFKLPFSSYDDVGNELPGIFSNNKYMVYRSSTNGSKHVWERYNTNSIPTGITSDKRSSLSVPPEFLTSPSYGLPSYAMSDWETYGDGYYVSSLYFNKLQIPFRTIYDGSVFNDSFVKYYDSDNVEYVQVKKGKSNTGRDIYLYEMQGDYITNINISGDKITFKYVIGGRYWAERVCDNLSSGTSVSYKYNSDVSGDYGVRYEEQFDYYPNTVSNDFEFQLIDGSTGNYPITYDYIDFETSKVSIYHEELKLTREGNIADIEGYEAGSVWNNNYFEISAIPYDDKYVFDDGKNIVKLSGNTGESILTPIYKSETLNAITADIKTDISFTLSRGSAAAMETHYKISECSTLEDMENYGNNYFNM